MKKNKRKFSLPRGVCIITQGLRYYIKYPYVKKDGRTRYKVEPVCDVLF
jgi:hypothetical protein